MIGVLLSVAALVLAIASVWARGGFSWPTLSPKRIQWLCAFLSILGASIYLYAQNPVSISQVGTTPVTTTVPVSGTVTIIPSGTQTVTGTVAATQSGAWSLSANQSVNVAQMGGAATSMNTGVRDAGTQRVTIATNDVVPVSQSGAWSLSANQSVNVAQLAGTATDTNSGNKSAGTLRVVLATDQPALTNKLLVTPDSVALPANQSVNVAQMNGVATTMGAGATGTGVQRTNDVASAATGAAPPAAAAFIGGLQSGATGGFLGGIAVADTFKGVNVSTATTTLMVTGVSGRQVRVSSFHLVTAAANNVQWISGTGATCGTGTTGIGGGGTSAASGYNFAANGGIAVGTGVGQVFTTTATGDSLCIVTSAATQLSGVIAYSIY